MRIHPLLPVLGAAVIPACTPAPAAEARPTFRDVVGALDESDAHLRALHALAALPAARVRVVHVDALSGSAVQALAEGVDDRVGETTFLRAVLHDTVPGPNLAALRRALAARRVPISRVVALDVDPASGVVTIFRS